MNQTPDRRFPRPWSIIEEGESFRVVDAKGFAICYIYYEDNADKVIRGDRMNRKQAGAMASKIAQLPELLDLKPKA